MRLYGAQKHHKVDGMQNYGETGQAQGDQATFGAQKLAQEYVAPELSDLGSLEEHTNIGTRSAATFDRGSS
jgi:hypothetical protein